jgi:predicted ester cyclase
LTEGRPGADAVGGDEFREHHKAASDALSSLSAWYQPVAGDGQRLAADATVTDVYSGEFVRVPATSKAPGWREVHLFEIRDGRVAEHWIDATPLSPARLRRHDPGNRSAARQEAPTP